MVDLQRPTYTRRIPTVLTQPEVRALLESLAGPVALIARLLYETGMRMMEAMRLRIKDVNFDRPVIVVRQAKGNKDRVVMPPKSLAGPLQQQVAASRRVWDEDRAGGRSGVEVPHALESQYPKVGQTWGWFWVFPSPTQATDPRSGVIRRHHLYEERLQRAIKGAVVKANIHKRVSAHTLRHRFATHLLQAGTAIRTVQELLDHSDVSTTMICTHVLKVAAGDTASPLDALPPPPASRAAIQADPQAHATRESEPGHAQQAPLLCPAFRPGPLSAARPPR